MSKFGRTHSLPSRWANVYTILISPISYGVHQRISLTYYLHINLHACNNGNAHV